MHDSEAAPQSPAINTKYIVDDSPTKASVITIVSLMLFGSSLFGALMRYASVGDLNSIRALLLRDDTIGWISTVIVTLTPTFWLVYRTIRSWFHKAREAEITSVVEKVDPSVALTKSTARALMAPPPPTRARETATPGTRLVDKSVLLHRPVAAAIDSNVVTQFSSTVTGPWSDAPGGGPEIFMRMSHDAGTTWAEPVRVTGDNVPAKRSTEFDDMMANPTIAEFLGAPHTAPLIPGDALAAPVAADLPSSKSKFTETHEDWKRAGKPGPFDKYLEERDWVWDEGERRWTHPETKD